MMIDKMKSTTFKQVDFEEWKEVAISSLRGKPLENLITKTAENIEIQPLYTKEQPRAYSNEKLINMIETVRNGKQKPTWTVAQQQYANTGKKFLNQLEDSLKRGNEAVVYNGNYPIMWEKEELVKLAKLIQEHPFYVMNLKKGDLFTTVFKLIPLEERAKVQGAISGESVVLPEGYEQIRTISADAREIHNNGADSITELATVLAKAADYMDSFESFSVFESQFFTQFAVDTHFFMEIAKIRAFRVLWQTFRGAYGETTSCSVPVFSENSLRSYSKLDPYVNLLRAGNEAFSAILGGADVLTIHPHDVLTGATAASMRLARNVQLIIKEETIVSEVIDPAGGSYFIEALTKELVEKAWALFQEIELQGGYNAYVSSGELEKKLKSLRKFRMEEIMRAEKSLIGTNIYADLSTPFVESEDVVQLKPRFAKPYEALRSSFEKNQPNIVVLTFGKLKDFKPRADFIGGFLATGGLKSEWSPAFQTAKEALDWIRKNPFDYGVICASSAELEAVMSEFLKDMPTSLWIDVAGKYEGKQERVWRDAGVEGFIYKGQDQIAKLTELKNKWGREKS